MMVLLDKYFKLASINMSKEQKNGHIKDQREEKQNGTNCKKRQINKNKSMFFEKIYKVDKHSWTDKGKIREKTQITKINKTI